MRNFFAWILNMSTTTEVGKLMRFSAHCVEGYSLTFFCKFIYELEFEWVVLVNIARFVGVHFLVRKPSPGREYFLHVLFNCFQIVSTRCISSGKINIVEEASINSGANSHFYFM